MKVLTSGTAAPLYWSQSGSTILSIWYQTTERLPGLPATLHGQSTRALPWWARLIGGRKSHFPGETYLPTSSMMRLGSGVGALIGPPVLGTAPQPPLLLLSRSSVSQAK